MKSFIVDAFCDQPFSGNPAAVVLQSRALTDVELQNIAAEFNLSETAFLQPLDAAGERWHLRWFTPQAEVALCGHATLASAHALWDQCQIEADTLVFDTLSGTLRVRRDGEQMEMDFPICTTRARPVEGWPRALSARAIAAAEAGEDLLLELPSEAAVREFVADIPAIAALPARGLIVTAAGDEVDIVSRFFAPAVGIDEDPVTGSAHCALAHYWQAKLGREVLRARQLSRRGGCVDIVVRGERVGLRGRALSVLAGELFY